MSVPKVQKQKQKTEKIIIFILFVSLFFFTTPYTRIVHDVQIKLVN